MPGDGLHGIGVSGVPLSAAAGAAGKRGNFHQHHRVGRLGEVQLPRGHGPGNCANAWRATSASSLPTATKEANWIVNRYEETLFLPEDSRAPVVLDKTRTQGDLYRSVTINGQETQLPKPFLFSLHPAANHPRAARRARLGRIVCLYDNAGEHYNVGQDTALTPVTRHLFAFQGADVPAGPDAGPALPRAVQAHLAGSADR